MQLAAPYLISGTSLPQVLVFKLGFEVHFACLFRTAGLIQDSSERLRLLNKYPLSRNLDDDAFSAQGGGCVVWMVRLQVVQFFRMGALGSLSAMQLWQTVILGMGSHLGPSECLRRVAALPSLKIFQQTSAVCAEQVSLVCPDVKPSLATAKLGGLKGDPFSREKRLVTLRLSLKLEFNNWVFSK